MATKSPNDAITLSNSIIRGESNVLDSYKPTLFSKDENTEENKNAKSAETGAA